MAEELPIIDLAPPHGFLVWRRKQHAIASPTLLPTGDVMVTSDGEAFGIALLAQPSQVSLSEFERLEGKHSTRPDERESLWPNVDSFYIYDIKGWRGFGQPWIIVQPASEVLVENNKKLLKTIIVHPDAISVDGSIDGIKNDELLITLETVFNCVKHEGEKALPFYELVPVGQPILRFEDIKKKELTMPYDINDDDCVVNTDSGEVEKCHDSHEEAMAHLAALNANVEDAKDSTLPEDEKAVTKKENGMNFSRGAYLYAPGDEVSEWKLRIEAEPGQVTKAQLGAAAAALSSGGFRGQRVSLSAEDKRKAAKRLISEYRKLDVDDDDIPDHLFTTAGKAGRRLASGWVEKLRAAKDFLMELASWAEYADQVEEEEMMTMDMLKGDSGVSVKMVDGEPWHLSWSSNSFQDRDGEFFSLKSLEQYVEENSENEVKGYFNLWHIKGTDFAEKRFQAIVGKFLFEAGPYLKDYKGKAARKFFEEYGNGHPEIAPEGWGASVEYKYLPEERKSKVYEWTWITRTSTLARSAAANVWTKSSQENFTMNDEQRKAATALFGEEFTNRLIAQGQQKTKELEDAGIANKASSSEEKSSEEPKPEEKGIDVTQMVEELAAKMMTNVNEALVPVLGEFQQQILTLREEVKNLSEEMKALKKDEAIKQQVELPRFTFDRLVASQSSKTAVPEGDPLRDKKPQEVTAGSLTQAYFPNKK